MIIILVLILAILVLLFGGLFVIGVSSIIPEYVWFYIVWGYIIVGVVAHIIYFVSDGFQDIDLKKKKECIRCEGYCDKCVANKYRILHNLRGPRKKLPEQMVFHGLGSYSGMCEVCWKYAKEYYTYDKWWINDNHAICLPCYAKRGK